MGKVLASIVILALAAMISLKGCELLEFRPNAIFVRHFGDPIPASVIIAERSGFTALAGSSEYLVFSVSTNDLSILLRRRQLKEIPLTVNTTATANIWNLVSKDELSREVVAAHAKGFVATKAYVNGKDGGRVWYLLLVDQSGTNVLYHYVKM